MIKPILNSYQPCICDRLQDVQSILAVNPWHLIGVKMTGVGVNDQYPHIDIFINSKKIWQGPVVSTMNLNFGQVPVHTGLFQFEIVYFGKTDQHTILQNDQVIQNQCLKIDQLSIDDIDITGYDLQNFSMTNYQLTESKKIAYNKAQAPWENVKTDTLYDNGSWKIEIKEPVVSNLVRMKKTPTQIFDVSHVDILSKLQNYFKED